MKSNVIDGSSIRIISLWGILLLLAVISLGVMTRGNIQFAEQNPGGSDFLVAWEGMRSVLQGDSPYSEETAERIQKRWYGRPALPGENQMRVPYPLYSLLFLAPLYLTADYSAARGIWMTIVELATMGFALASIRLSGRKWARWQVIVFLLFSLLWYFGLRAIINGNVVILVAFFLAAALVCLQKKWDWAAGILLACSTFKPQIALFPIVCCLLWLVMTRRFRPILAFLASMLVFIGIGWMLVPTWIADNWREVSGYPSYNPPGNPESSLRKMFGVAGSWMGIALSIAVSAAIGFLWLRLRKADEKKFLEILSLSLILAPLCGMQTDAGNQYILLLPVAGLLLRPDDLPSGSRPRFILLALILFFGLWGMFLLTVRYETQPVQHPMMLFPLPFFLLGIWLWDAARSRRKKITAS